MSVAALLLREAILLVTIQRYCAPFRTVALATVSVVVDVPLYGGTSAMFVHEAPAFVDTCH
jgi:hypothetical protein